MIFMTYIGVAGLVLGGVLLLAGRKRGWTPGLIGSSYCVGIGFLFLGISIVLSNDRHTHQISTPMIGVVGIVLGVGFLVQALAMPTLMALRGQAGGAAPHSCGRWSLP